MTLKAKYEYKHEDLLRDSRPLRVIMIEGAQKPEIATSVFVSSILMMYANNVYLLYFWWLRKRDVMLPFKLPKSANRLDARNKLPSGALGQADGILYLGNDTRTNEEIWFTNNDARTHTLYLGTTGSGKTFGLKSFSCNALTWASGYIYIDGKADTDLWSTLSAAWGAMTTCSS